MNAVTKLKNSVKNLHSNEAGLQTLDTVMIVAIAAIVLFLIVNFGKSFFQTMQDAVQQFIQ